MADARLVAPRAPAFRHLRAAHGGAHAPAVVGPRRLVVALLAIIGGMWWWGFDFGQILGGFNRKEIEARLAHARNRQREVARRRPPSFARATRTLESELAMTRGAQEALSRQATELSGENAQLKEELAFLQKLVVRLEQDGRACRSSGSPSSPDGDDMWRYSLLIVRGGSPKDEFVGNVVAAGHARRRRRRPDAPPDGHPAARRRARGQRRRSPQIQVLSAG